MIAKGIRQRWAAAFLAVLICSTYVVDAGSVGAKIESFLKNKAAELASKAGKEGVDGMSNYIADELAAQGEPEAAEAVPQSGDVLEELIETAIDATACAGSVGKVASKCAAVPGVGLVLAAGCSLVTGIFTPSCRDAVVGVIQTGVQVGEAAAAIGDAYDAATAPECQGNQVDMPDVAACSDHCNNQYPGCFTWYMDHNCCLCKPFCDEDASGGADEPTDDWLPVVGDAPAAAPVASSTTPSGSDASTCSEFEYDVDYWGGDIVPVTTKWADTAVAAASPQDCCDACNLYSYCQAWTFTAIGNCKERLPNAKGCCFLKKATDWEAKPAPGMISGTTLGVTAASCTLEFDTNLAGGEIFTSAGAAAVVATYSDADCCQSCAATEGCGAWTMTPPSYCTEAAPGAVGCCFLKYASGWTRSPDSEGVLTSGVLL